MATSPASAQIKRATKFAQEQSVILDGQALANLRERYQIAVNEIAAIINRLGIDGTVRQDRLGQLLGQAERIIEKLGSQHAQYLSEWMLDAAVVGVEPFAATVGGSITHNLPAQTVQALDRFIHADGLSLSARVHTNTEDTKARVRRHLTRAIVSGESASVATALDLLEQGKVPYEVKKALLNASPEKLRSILKHTVLDEPGSPYQTMRRIYRTEINRAFGTAYNASAQSHPDAVGLRFLLSPRHPEHDICDMHAKVNKWGMGRGVYPFDKCPWPAHPNTLSFTEVVFDEEVTSADRRDESRIDWLKNQDRSTQAAVLGSQKKAKALRLGILTERQIATPWYKLKLRYAKTGDLAKIERE